VYAHRALGYTLVYGIIPAHQLRAERGRDDRAMVAYSVHRGAGEGEHWPPPGDRRARGLLAAIPVCMAVGYTLERVAYRPLRRAPRLAR
jgi:branched-chain amino acid transport system permease protein